MRFLPAFAAVAVAFTHSAAAQAGAAAPAPPAAGPAAPAPTAGASGTADAYVPAAPVWAACSGVALRELECAEVEVPLDHAEPEGRKIKIAVSRKKATAPAGEYRGILLTNPGGPGASGLDAPNTWFRGKGAEAVAGYDIIGFAPRGVAPSKPALSCDRNYERSPEPDPVPSGAAALKTLWKRASGYAAACGKRFGWLLPYLDTASTARDMDAIRAALKQPKLSYMGISYGTYLGAVYGTLFPDRVNRMVLDSVVRPSGVWYQANFDQNAAMEGRIHDFFQWTAKHHGTFRLGRTAAAVRAKYAVVRARLKASPVEKAIGAKELDDILMKTSYTHSVWSLVAESLSAKYLRNENNALAMAFFMSSIGKFGENGQSDNGIAMYLAVECADTRWPRDWATWRKDTLRSLRRAPIATWSNTWMNAPCAFWPASARNGNPVRIKGDGLKSALLVQSTKDGPTPYAGAVETLRLIPAARLVLEDGGGEHGVSYTGNACVDAHVTAYLRDGTLPAAKVTRCAARSAPRPDSPGLGR
ncbi:alpha/beta hydrolase fold [Sinosporangium album]|uniref:Alpha/beta hydrolase fold n=1 Tax=Sinosporangium album TaxID=504805 RepID=A0A1G8C7B5_9ACTN|nr:alpha/beta hydrolase [Sinosporangium album]SDH41268.1 alpha/beta hydrolase fold [Sinosporangium album]